MLKLPTLQPILTRHMSGRMNFIGAAIGAVGSIIGSKIAGKDAKENAADSRDFTKEQLQNMHQWEVADLRKAGLNPVLSAHGSGSPGGSAMAQTYNPVGETANMINSALSAKKVKAEIDLLKATAKKQSTGSVKDLADARNVGNVADISQNIANLSKGAHEATADLASSAKGVYRKKEEIKSKLKKAPSDYGWALKNPKAILNELRR